MRRTFLVSVPGSVVLVLVVGLVACGRGWVQDHPDLARRAQENPGAFVEPARALTESLDGLGANYSMRATKGIAGRSFDLYISVQRPDRIDISVQAPTGLTEAYLRANGREVGLFIREDLLLYSGPATRDAFTRALGFGLSAADAVALLLGEGVDARGRPRGIPRWDDKARRVRIDYGAAVRLWLHPLTMRFDRVEHDGAGSDVVTVIEEWIELAVEAAAGRSAERGGLQVEELGGEGEEPTGAAELVAVPSLLKIDVQPDGIGLRLRMVGQAQPNPEYLDDYFDLQRPPGVTELPLSDLARDGGLFRRLDDATDGGP